jgi:hypothetical protein
MSRFEPELAFTARRRQREALSSLSRCCVAIGVGAMDRHTYPADLLQREWPDDREAQLLLKASSEPPPGTASSSVAALLRTIIPSLFETLGPASAGAQLLGRGLQLNFDTAYQINLPAIVADPTLAAFTAEGAPISVVQPVVESWITLKANKELATSIVLTRELLEISNAQVLMSDLLISSTALALDACLFDATAADATRPAGLLNGITALTATTVPTGGSTTEAMLKDIENLVAVVSQITAEPPVLIACPSRAIAMQLRAPHTLAPLTVLASSAVPANNLIAVAPIAVASATGSAPEIRASDEATLNMANPAAAIIAAGGTLAVSTRSLWQTDATSIKLRLPTDWALRDPRGIAYVSTTAW